MAQIKLHDQRKPLELWKLIGRCTVSCISVLLSQFALSLVPRFFSASPLFIQLILSALVLLVVVGLGRCSKRLLGVSGSASAFVFFNILFIWAVYLAVLRPAVSCLMDIAFNGAIIMLIIGLCSIMSSNPGLVTYGSSDELVESSVAEGSVLGRRVRYCRICKGYIKGFDHHCPAFGNCIGQNNHVLFMVLLLGFLSTEASYVVCSSQFAAKSQIVDRTRLETSLSGNLAISTMLFSIFQLLWQINWEKYPEFQDVVHFQQGKYISTHYSSKFP
ncbi:palmitoyltransferase zdhhc3 [Quercus suber]|uniref:S-acyltransferase n=1 Tax=Quercus suber TaxID=58331 RepID=A0AAW0KBB5_QUESU